MNWLSLHAMRKLQIFSVPAATPKGPLFLVIYKMAQAVAHKARSHLTECGSAMQDGIVECARISRIRPLTPGPVSIIGMRVTDPSEGSYKQGEPH